MVNHSKPARFCETSLLILLAVAILWKGGKTLESTWLLAGVAAGCSLLVFGFSFRETQARQVPRSLHCIILLFILWTFLSYVFSKTQNYGLDEVLRDGALGLLLLWYLRREPETKNPSTRAPLGAGHSQEQGTPSFEERWLTWLARFTVASCIIGIVIYLFQPVNRFVGTFVDPRFHTDYWPNAFAEFLLLTWPIVLLSLTAKNPKFENRNSKQIQSSKSEMELFRASPSALRASVDRSDFGFVSCFGFRILKLLSLSLVLGSLFLTYSRGAFVALLGQVALLLLLLLLSRQAVREVQRPLATLAVSLLFGTFVFGSINGARSFFYPVQSLSEKVAFTAEEGTSSISERKEFWRQALRLTAEKPLFGWGPYSFRFVQPRLQESVLATSDHPHNVFLKLSAERGVGASILFAIVVVFSLFTGVKVTLAGKRLHASDHTRCAAPLLTVSLAGVLAHNLIDYNLQFVGIVLPFWMMMGMLLQSAPLSVVQKFQIPKPKSQTISNVPHFAKASRGGQFSIFNSLIAVLLLLIALREGTYLVTSSLGRHAEVRREVTAALRWYRRSRQEWFTRDMHLSEAYLLLQEEEGDEAEAAIQIYFRKNAEDARAWKLLGAALASRGDFPAAIEAYEQAFALGSWNDLSISRSLLEALFAETYTQPTSDAAADSTRLPLHPRIAMIAPEIERRVLAFEGAIQQNRHFVALSPNPEEAIKILITLSILYPEREEQYRLLRENIEVATERERSKTTARSPGWFW